MNSKQVLECFIEYLFKVFKWFNNIVMLYVLCNDYMDLGPATWLSGNIPANWFRSQGVPFPALPWNSLGENIPWYLSASFVHVLSCLFLFILFYFFEEISALFWAQSRGGLQFLDLKCRPYNLIILIFWHRGKWYNEKLQNNKKKVLIETWNFIWRANYISKTLKFEGTNFVLQNVRQPTHS